MGLVLFGICDLHTNLIGWNNVSSQKLRKLVQFGLAVHQRGNLVLLEHHCTVANGPAVLLRLKQH
jgi:hypothetical protein